MARKRMIDSEIWRDKKVVRLSNDGFILWIAIISMADDEGIFEYDPDAWFYEIARKGLTATKIKAAMAEIIAQKMVVIYGDGYGFVPAWYKHQTLSHPTPSKSKRPPKEIIDQYPEYLTAWTKTFTTYRKDEAGNKTTVTPNYPYPEPDGATLEQFRKTPEDSGNIQKTPGSIVEVSLVQSSLDKFSLDESKSARVESPPPPVKTFPPALRIQESLILPIRKSFEYFNPQGFTAPALEDPAIVDLAEKFARLGRDNPGDFARAVLEKFHELTVSQDKFWRGQPYTPSSLNNPKIFDRVIAEMKTEEVQDERESWADMEIRLRAKMKAKEAV